MSGDASSSTTATAATGGEAVVDVTVTSATTGGVAVTVTYAGTGGVDTVTSAAASSAGPSNAAADQAQVHKCTAYSCCSHMCTHQNPQTNFRSYLLLPAPAHHTEFLTSAGGHGRGGAD